MGPGRPATGLSAALPPALLPALFAAVQAAALAGAIAAAAWALPARPAEAAAPAPGPSGAAGPRPDTAAQSGGEVRLTVAGYAAVLDQVGQRLAAATQLAPPDAARQLQAAADLLPEAALVNTPSGPTRVDHRRLRARLTAAAGLRAPQVAEAVGSLKESVDLMRSRLHRGEPPGALDMGAERERLARALRPPPPNPLRDLQERLADRLAQWFGRRELRLGGATRLSPTAIALLGAAGAAILIWAGWFMLRQLRAQRAVVGEGPAGLARGQPLAASPQPEALWDEAAALARRTDFRAALRALYLALLLHLDRQGRIRFRSAATNGAYLRELARSPDLYGPVRDLTRLFESRWYGRTPAGAADLAAAAALARSAWAAAGGAIPPEEVTPGAPLAE